MEKETILDIGVWSHGILQGVAGKAVFAACLLISIVPARWLLRRAVLRCARRWSRQPGGSGRQALAIALIPPVCFIPVVIAALLMTAFVAPGLWSPAVSAGIDRSLFAILAFWALFRIMEPLCSAFYGHAQLFSHAMINWTVRVAKIVIIAVGISVILEIWGLHVGPILTGLGLFGLAAGLGAQDMVKNLIAGMFIIGERRFKNGDWVRAEQIVDGVVENIGLRATRIRRWDMAPAYVPNAKLADNAVTNFGQMAYRKISWVVGLECRTSVDQLRRIRDGIEAYILGDEAFAHPPEAPWTFVRVDGFAESSINLMVHCFSRSTDWGDWLKTKEDLTYAIMRIVEDAGAGFAFPSRSLYVETMPAGVGAPAAPPRRS